MLTLQITRPIVCLALLETIGATAPVVEAATLIGPTTVLIGDRPHLGITGVPPRSQVNVENFRFAKVSVRSSDGWTQKRLLFHAQASFWADARGKVDVDHAAPLTGSYSGIDPRGLLWSGPVVGRAPEGDVPADVPSLGRLGDTDVRLIVRVQKMIMAVRDIHLRPWTDTVRFTTIATPEVTGVFTAPRNGRRRPTLILLHGSEGGSLANAKELAGRFASRGYAALSLVYFSWPGEHLKTVPQSFTDLPIEPLDWARKWLAQRPEVDTQRLALVGGSKGAEFGLLGASIYPWVRAVVACVPSSVVWGGFGAATGGHATSFLHNGQPLPSIPYSDYSPVSRGEMTSTERHRRDRAAADPASVAAAAIPLEKGRARLLLLSGVRDTVWPSDAMSAEIVARLNAAGQERRAAWLSFPDAVHYLCGTGTAPIRADEGSETALGGGLVSADGRDPGRAWDATLAFLHRTLATGPTPNPAQGQIR